MALLVHSGRCVEGSGSAVRRHGHPPRRLSLPHPLPGVLSEASSSGTGAWRKPGQNRTREGEPAGWDNALRTGHTADGLAGSLWLARPDRPSSGQEEPKVPSQRRPGIKKLALDALLGQTMTWWRGLLGLPLPAPLPPSGPWSSTGSLDFTSALARTSGKCRTLVMLRPVLLPGRTTAPGAYELPESLCTDSTGIPATTFPKPFDSSAR